MRLFRFAVLSGFLFLLLPSAVTADDLPFDSVRTVSFDSARTTLRHFDSEKINELVTDPELDYGQGPAAMSLWERFKRWLASIFRSAVDATIDANWFEILIIILMVVVLIYVILRLLNIDALKMFYGTSGRAIRAEILEENIHEMDFEKLVTEAVRRSDYRLAIRLLFLHSLKILADKQLIHWQPGKTNHDYLDELKEVNVKTGFNELNYYFEYAWYGNFTIAPELFGKVKNTFNQWKDNI